MHPHPFSTARFSTQRLSHTHLHVRRQHRDGSFALNRLLLPGRGFSHRVEDSSVSSREAPLVLSGPRPVLLGPYTRVCICMLAGTHALHFLSLRLVRSYIRSRRVEGRPTAAREEDRAWPRSPAPRSAFIWSRNISYFPSSPLTLSLSLSLSLSPS